MKIIYGERGTGKTKQLLEYAYENRATVVTKNARALKVKAQAYGLNVDIIEVNSLSDNMPYEKRIVIHGLNDYLEDYFNNRGTWLMGATVRVEE